MRHRQEGYGSEAVKGISIVPGVKHKLVVLMLDTSRSMGKDCAIGTLNTAISHFKTRICVTGTAEIEGVEIALITFGGDVRAYGNNRSDVIMKLADMPAPVLVAGGGALFYGALERTLDLVDARKKQYKDAGASWYVPKIFVLTGARPTDTDHGVVARLHADAKRHGVGAYCMGIGRFDHGQMSYVFGDDRVDELKVWGFNNFFGSVENYIRSY